MATNAELFALLQGRIHHAAPGTPVATPDATNTTTAVTLATALRAAMVAHFADDDPHAAADMTTELPADTNASASNLASFTRALAGAFEDHAKRADLHYSPDPNWRTDVHETPSESYVWRRLNAIKSAWNAHVVNALAPEV